MPESISFGIWLRQHRRALDLTQKTLADQVGCAEITVRRMEADEYKPSSELALVLFEKLGIPEFERPRWVRFARGIAGFPTSPSGTVAFLFTDVEGSTKLAREHPEIWEALLARHHAILQKAIESNKGYIFQIIGDAFCAAFHTTEDAIHAAVESQKNLQAENWGDVPVKVRMGINTGKAEIQKNGEYHGYLAMSRVQRLMSAAHGGQTLLSATTEQLTRDTMSKDITLRDLGERRLKDMPQPEHIFQLIIPSLPTDFPPLRTLEASPNNLPSKLTSFIGREKEQAEVIKHIRKYRLVTLTGPGGVGKTRLSIEVGEQVSADYANGVWLVELASLNDPTLLPQTVIALFGIAAQTKTSHTEILINFLRAKTILLILDNCEHLLEACAQLADTLLKNCPNLKILATSRESLGITGEAAYPVPSLGLPDLELLLENFRGNESVRLFEERAQLAKMDFSLTIENASSVAQICHRLDGIPLAIELAAAHVNMFSTEQIAVRLNESFNLLTGGSRTALPRQQTIRASIEWGWNLLSDSERILLRCLSVFAGGWILESAEAVCGGDNVVELMSQLVAKSLVMATQVSGRARRYHLLETIRQYTHEIHIEAGEEENFRTQHLKYFLYFSEQAESALKGPAQIEWYARVTDERDNIRAALDWADKTDVEAGLFIAGRLERFWVDFDLHEGARWLSRFLEASESHSHPHARAKALYTHGMVLYAMGNIPQLEAAAEDCLRLYRLCGDPHGEIDGLFIVGRFMFASNNMTRTRELNQQTLDLSEALGDTWRKAFSLGNLGWTAINYQQQVSYWTEAVKLFREVGDLRLLEDYLSTLGHYEVLNGDFESAQRNLDEAIQLHHKSNRKGGVQFIPTTLSRLETRKGNFEKARILLEEDIAIQKELGAQGHYLWTRAHLGRIVLQQGEIAQARGIFVETAQDFLNYKNEIGVEFTLEGMAGLFIALDKHEATAQLIGWADSTRKKIGNTRLPVEQADVDQIIAACIAKLGEATFSDAYDEGQKMTLDEAVAYAFAES